LRVNKETFIIFLLFLILFSPLSVSADMGPKPKITVIVTNTPNEEYYLDLLVNYDLPLSDNLHDLRETLDVEKMKILAEYNENGWYCALVHGTRNLIWGELTGEKAKGNVIHTFGYFGLPDLYKIIIVTPENEVVTTRTIEKKSYTSTVYYNYETGEITEGQGITLAWTYIKQFLMTFVCTLILESIILLIFHFKSGHTLRVFFITNLLTQIIMTLIMSTSLLIVGIYASYVVLIAVEVIITAIEATAYAFIIKEGTKRKRVAYAVIANLISSLAMLPLMYFEYLLFIY